MNKVDSIWAGDRRGIAAVEFALVAPLLLLLLGGTADFGLLMSKRSQLANGVAQGVQYALQQGPGLSAANVRAMVQSGATRAGMTQAVTVTTTGPVCYCVSGPPAALSAAPAPLSGSTCPGSCAGTGAAPDAYLTISASYIYQPLMPLYSHLASTKVSQASTVRLQ